MAQRASSCFSVVGIWLLTTTWQTLSECVDDVDDDLWGRVWIGENVNWQEKPPLGSIIDWPSRKRVRRTLAPSLFLIQILNTNRCIHSIEIWDICLLPSFSNKNHKPKQSRKLKKMLSDKLSVQPPPWPVAWSFGVKAIWRLIHCPHLVVSHPWWLWHCHQHRSPLPAAISNNI